MELTSESVTDTAVELAETEGVQKESSAETSEAAEPILEEVDLSMACLIG